MYLYKGRYYEYIAPTVAYIKLYMKINIAHLLKKGHRRFRPGGETSEVNPPAKSYKALSLIQAMLQYCHFDSTAYGPAH